jgi:MFS family permease
MQTFQKNYQYRKFCAYGFLKNLRFYDAFLLLFFLENGIAYSQIGLLYAAREIVINVAEIPSGFFADAYGRKNALILAFCGYILGFVTFYYSNHFGLLLSAMLFVGLGDAMRSGTHKGMIMDYLSMQGWEDQKVAYYGHTRSWSQRGSALSALLAGLMVFYTGSYRLIYLFSVIPYLLNFINIYTYPKALNYSLKKKKKKRFSSYRQVIVSFVNNVKKRSVLKVMNSAALHSAFLKAIKDYIQPIMLSLTATLPFLVDVDTKNRSGIIIGVIYFFIFLMTAQASKNAVKFTQLNLKNMATTTLLAGLTAGLVCGVLAYFQIWWASLIAFLLIYLVENIRKPIMTGLLADQVPNEVLTSVLSAQSFYQTFVTSAIAISIGILADFGGVGVAMIVISALLMIVLMLSKK